MAIWLSRSSLVEYLRKTIPFRGGPCYQILPQVPISSITSGIPLPPVSSWMRRYAVLRKSAKGIMALADKCPWPIKEPKVMACAEYGLSASCVFGVCTLAIWVSSAQTCLQRKARYHPQHKVKKYRGASSATGSNDKASQLAAINALLYQHP